MLDLNVPLGFVSGSFGKTKLITVPLGTDHQVLQYQALHENTLISTVNAKQGKTTKMTSCIDGRVLNISFPFASETANISSSKRREQRSSDQDEESTSRPTLESFSNTNSTDDAIDDKDDDSFSWDDEDDEEFEDPSRKEPSFLKREQMAVLMAREDFKVLKLVGHRFEDMVLSCMFRGVSCG